MTDDTSEPTAVERLVDDHVDDPVDVETERDWLELRAVRESDAAAGAALVAAYQDLAAVDAPESVLDPVRTAANRVAAQTAAEVDARSRADEAGPSTDVVRDRVVNFGVDRDRAAEVRAASLLVTGADDPGAVAADAGMTMPLRFADTAVAYRGLDRIRKPDGADADLDATRETLRTVAARENSRVRAAGALAGLRAVRESDDVDPAARVFAELTVEGLVDLEHRRDDGGPDQEAYRDRPTTIDERSIREFVARATALPGATPATDDRSWPTVEPADREYTGLWARTRAEDVGAFDAMTRREITLDANELAAEEEPAAAEEGAQTPDDGGETRGR